MISLPSKRAQSIIVLLLGLIVAVVLIFGQNTVQRGVKSINTLVVGEKVALPENPNWQEDFSRVIVSADQIPLTSNFSTSTKNADTLTDTVSRSLMTNYLSLKQQGNLDQTNTQNLINQTLSYIDSSAIKKIEIKSLNIIPDEGVKSTKEYGERLGYVFLIHKPEKGQNEMQLLQQAINERNLEKIKELQKIALTYMQIAEDLKKIPVPTTFQRSHLDIVNSLITMSISVSDMSNAFNDPMKALVSLQSYQEGGYTFLQAMNATASYLLKNNISYKQGTGGYYVMSGL